MRRPPRSASCARGSTAASPTPPRPAPRSRASPAPSPTWAAGCGSSSRRGARGHTVAATCCSCPPRARSSAAAIERWFRRAARAEVLPRLDAAAAALGKDYSRLTIRDQRTRWGSCSATGAIAINWRLLLGPEEVLDYVIWHEACHLAVMDHSPRFWGLLARHVPDYEQPRAWLRRSAPALTL